jgi:glycerophosphoryl diester phosphodiesterase
MLPLILFILAAQPIPIAHRGGAAHWPENTLEAFRGVIAAGVPIIETDTVLTKDNRLALNHDLTTPLGPIRLHNFNELGRPALEDLFQLIAGTRTEVMLETKMAQPGAPDYVDPETVVRAIDLQIRKFNLASRIILQSFDHRTLAVMKRLNPAVRLCLLNPRTRLPDYVAPAKALGAQIQFINFRIIEQRDVDVLHAAGLKVFSGTTSDPKEWQRLTALGVDAILTDAPLELMKN